MGNSCGTVKAERIGTPDEPPSPTRFRNPMRLLSLSPTEQSTPKCLFVSLSSSDLAAVPGIKPGDRMVFTAHLKVSASATLYYECAKSNAVHLSDAGALSDCKIIVPLLRNKRSGPLAQIQQLSSSLNPMSTQKVFLMIKLFTANDENGEPEDRVGRIEVEFSHGQFRSPEMTVNAVIQSMGDRTKKRINRNATMNVSMSVGYPDPGQLDCSIAYRLVQTFSAIEAFIGRRNRSARSEANMIERLRFLDDDTFVKLCHSRYLLKVAKAMEEYRFRKHAKNRTEFARMLGCKLTEGILDAQAKRMIVDALTRSEATDAGQQVVHDIILSFSEEDLSDAKRLLDTEGSNNLSNIVFDYISDKKLQTNVVRHIRSEAEKVMARSDFKRPVVILSDIDDTFVHSGWGLGGPKYPAGTVLPGYLALVKELDARLVFITARPGFLAKSTYTKLQEFGVQHPNVLTGVLADSLLIPFAPQQSNEWISERKFQNYLQYVQLFPEVSFHWWGDSGQGDVEMGLKMLAQQKDSGLCNIDAVFIQDVVKSCGITFKSDHERREMFQAQGIHILDDYLQVSLELHRQGKLNERSLKNIGDDFVAKLLDTWPKFQEKEKDNKQSKKKPKEGSTKESKTTSIKQRGHAAGDGDVNTSPSHPPRQCSDADQLPMLRAWDARVLECIRGVNAINELLATAGLDAIDLSKLEQVRGVEYVKYQQAVAEAQRNYDAAVAKARIEWESQVSGLTKKTNSMYV